LQGAAGEDERPGIGQFGSVAGGVVEHQSAAAQGGAAGVGVGSAEGKATSTDLHESPASAAKNAGEAGTLVVGSHVDGVGSHGEFIAALQTAEVVGIGAGNSEGDRLPAGGSGIQGAVEDGIDVAERQGAPGHGGVAGIGVRLAEGLGASAGLGHGDSSGAVVNQAVEGLSGAVVNSQSAGGA